MRNLFTTLLILFLIGNINSQSTESSFKLIEVQSDSLKKQFIEKNYQMNIILTYLKTNYTVSGGKTNIKKDEEMGGNECAFTQRFKEGISYSFQNCGEAKPVEEKLEFPKTNLDDLKKWIVDINNAYPMDIKHVWYKGENEYGPEDEGAGCYYKILTSKKKMKVEIWCGS